MHNSGQPLKCLQYAFATLTLTLTPKSYHLQAIPGSFPTPSLNISDHSFCFEVTQCLKNYTLFTGSLPAGQLCRYCFYSWTDFFQLDLPLVLQGRVESHKLGVVGNTSFVANFLRHITAKNYKNWFTNKKVIAKIKMVQFLFEKQCSIVRTNKQTN